MSPLLFGLVAVVFWCGASNPVFADFISVGVSVGAVASSDIGIESRSNDRASICDQYINPRALDIPSCVTPERGLGDGWLAPFDGSVGVSIGLEAQYALGSDYGLSAMYTYDAINFDQTVSSTDATGADFDKISHELSVGEESLGCSRAHTLFISAYRQWPGKRAWTPYAGIGVGLSAQRKEFSWNWARSADPKYIATGIGEPNEAEIRRNLAGTASTGGVELSDYLLGFLVYLGAERKISETLSMSIKAEWRTFESFNAGASGAEVLRSHTPNLRLDGSEPVSTWSKTDDTDRFALVLMLRYLLQ